MSNIGGISNPAELAATLEHNGVDVAVLRACPSAPLLLAMGVSARDAMHLLAAVAPAPILHKPVPVPPSRIAAATTATASAVANADHPCGSPIGHSRQAVFFDLTSERNCLQIIAIPCGMNDDMEALGVTMTVAVVDSDTSDDDGGAGAYGNVYDDDDDDDAHSSGSGSDFSNCTCEGRSGETRAGGRGADHPNYAWVYECVRTAAARNARFVRAPTRELARSDLFEVVNCAGEHFFIRACADSRTRGIPLVDIQRIVNAPLPVASAGTVVKMRISHAARFGNRYYDNSTLRCVYPDALYYTLHGHGPDASLAADSFETILRVVASRRKVRAKG